MGLSNAERQARWREQRKAGEPPVHYRRPADRRRRPERWRDAMPPGLAESPTAQKLDDVLALRGLVEELDAAELPRGFGRD